MRWILSSCPLFRESTCIHGTVYVLVRWILSSCPLFRESTCIHSTVYVLVRWILSSCPLFRESTCPHVPYSERAHAFTAQFMSLIQKSIGEVDPVLMSLIQRKHMYSWHSLCVGEVDPVLVSLIQKSNMYSQHSLCPY